jgi:hypothetical protein
MSENVKKIKILGINRSSDDNMIDDGYCDEIYNLEYDSGSFTVSNFVCIGALNSLESISAKSSIKAWLHYIDQNLVNLILLREKYSIEINENYVSGSSTKGIYYIYKKQIYKCIKEFENISDKIYLNNSNYFTKVDKIPLQLVYVCKISEINESKVSDADTSCFKVDSYKYELIHEGEDFTEDNISFVGSLLVINDNIFYGRKDYKSKVNKSEIKLDIHFKRLDEGIACYNDWYDTDSIRDNTVTTRVKHVTWNDSKCTASTRDGATEGYTHIFNTLNNELLRNGYFQGYAFLRYAIKLYDGSYINISPPVLVCSGDNSTSSSRYFFNNNGENIETNIKEVNTQNFDEISVSSKIDDYLKDEYGSYVPCKVYATENTYQLILPKIDHTLRLIKTDGEYEYDYDNTIELEKVSFDDYLVVKFPYCSLTKNRIDDDYASYHKDNAVDIISDDDNKAQITIKLCAKTKDEYMLSFFCDNYDENIIVTLDSDEDKFTYDTTKKRYYIKISGNGSDSEYSWTYNIKFKSTEYFNINLYDFQFEQGSNVTDYENPLPRVKSNSNGTYERQCKDIQFIERLANNLTNAQVSYNGSNKIEIKDLFVIQTLEGKDKDRWHASKTWFMDFNRYDKAITSDEDPYTVYFNNYSADGLFYYFFAYNNANNKRKYDNDSFCLFRRNKNYVQFYKDTHSFDGKRGFFMWLHDKIEDKNIRVTVQNFHNLTRMPEEYAFYGCLVSDNISDNNGNSKRPWGSVLGIRKMSSIGMKIYNENLSEFDGDLIQGIDVFMTLPVSIYENTSKKQPSEICHAHRDGKDDSVLETEILNSLNSFYLIKSIKTHEINKYNEYQNILEDVDLSSKVFVQRETLKNNSQLLEGLNYDSQYVYNNMLHVNKIKGRINRNCIKSLSYYITEGENEDFKNSGEVSTMVAVENDEVLYRSNNNSQYSFKDFNDSKEPVQGLIFLSSSEKSAKYAEFLIDDKGSHFAFDLKGINGNTSAYYPQFFLGYISDSDSNKQEFENITEDIIYEANILKVSKVDSPIVFPDNQTYRVGKGEIIAVHSNSKELSQGQSGVAPLYVFTTDGIYALHVDTTGEKAYTYVRTINSDVIVNKHILCDTNYGLVYGTKEGLKLLTGEQSKLISGKLNHNYPIAIYHPDLKSICKNKKIINSYPYWSGIFTTQDDGIIELISDKDAYIEYIENKEALLLYKKNNTNNIAYIINLKDGIITSIFIPIKFIIKGYPELYMFLDDYYDNNIDGTYIKLSSSRFAYRLSYNFDKNKRIGVYSGAYEYEKNHITYSNNYRDIFIVTRPIKLEGEEFKSITRIILRGFLDNYYDYSYIYENSIIRVGYFEAKKSLLKSGEYGIARAMGLYIYGSNDCLNWQLLGFTEKVNIRCRDIGTTLSHCTCKFIKVVFAGRLSVHSKIDYIEVQYSDKYTKKIR